MEKINEMDVQTDKMDVQITDEMDVPTDKTDVHVGSIDTVNYGSQNLVCEEMATSLDENNVKKEVFKIDRHKIQCVQQGPEELQSLGITIYDQDTFEKGILEQVDEALDRENRQDINSKYDGSSSEKRTEAVEISSEPTSLCCTETTTDVSSCSKASQNEIHDKAGINRKSILFQRLQQGSDETEYQRKIRLGEMTPFGSVVDKKDFVEKNGILPTLNGYFQSQMVLKKRPRQDSLKIDNKSNSRKIIDSVKQKQNEKVKTNKKSPLKKRILVPSKRKKKEELGCDISEPGVNLGPPGKLLSEVTPLYDSDVDFVPDNSSDSDYVPDVSEDDVKTEKKIKKQSPKQVRFKKSRNKARKIPEDWATDDSDWESSDEERRSKRRKSSKKEIDDGNIKDYEYRLRCWEATKTEDKSADHCLSGGYRLPKSYWCKLYKFQKVGVQWLWELHQQGCGGILGDEMGLGKTIQIISFLAGLSYSRLVSRHRSFRGLGPTLIVCPTTVLHQWVREFHSWWPQFRVAILHESGSFLGKREALINQIASKGGILVTSFTGVVQHSEILTARDWHYVILDEGHKIRNPDAQVTIAVKQFRTPHRLILSGSPMQNNLKELWSLFDFVFPGKLGTLPVFIAQFAVPITQGGYANASEVQVATAFKCATVLRDTISPFLLRRVKSDVKTHIQLPAKSEQVLFCRLTEEQRDLYRTYLDTPEVARILVGQAQVFMGLINLRKICNHPDLYSGGPKLFRGETEENVPEEQKYGYWKKSGKMIVVESLLKIWKKQGHKVLLFTQSRQMLCVLESFVQKEGYTYLKLDGGTSIAARQPLINKFNEDPSLFLFLLTTRVGGLGVNLTGANRVVIYDPDWNPATDTQARERAWRIGQQNQVTVYRLVTAGTIEEKVYHRQIFKQFLCNKVLSDPKQRRFFKSNDLFELFTLKEGDEEGSTETSAIFAGTGSEVKLKKLKAKMKKQKEIQEKIKSDVNKIHKPTQDSFKFSKSKLEHMKKLAKKLSEVIAAKKHTNQVKNEKADDMKDNLEVSEKSSDLSQKEAASTSSDMSSSKIVNEIVNELVNNAASKSETHSMVNKMREIEGKNSCQNDLQVSGSSITSGDIVSSESKAAIDHSAEKTETLQKDKPHRKKHKHKKSRKSKVINFEGNEVPYLVDIEDAKRSNEATVSETNAEQDDYVLKKLFKKSGLQTVLKHDKIMEGGPADHALVEGEAKRVAKEALLALRRSRQECFAAETGRPTWTGQSGVLRVAGRSKFIQKKSKPGSGIQKADATVSQQQAMSSSDLLARMRQRRALINSTASTSTEVREEEEIAALSENPEPSTPCLILPNQANADDNVDLLRDIRNFVAFGAIVDGRASTEEIVGKFRDRLPHSSTPVFKFLLLEVCDFMRLPSGEGMWKLKPEFQW